MQLKYRGVSYEASKVQLPVRKTGRILLYRNQQYEQVAAVLPPMVKSDIHLIYRGVRYQPLRFLPPSSETISSVPSRETASPVASLVAAK